MTTVASLTAYLDPDQRTLVAEVRRAAHDVFAPIAERGPVGAVDRDLLGALGDQGLLGRLFRKGSSRWEPDVSAVERCLIRESLAHGCTAAETAFAMQGLRSFPVLQCGTRDAVEEWIPRVASGQVAAGFALSEPQAGSDAALAMRADRDGTGWRLNGTKTWISNAPRRRLLLGLRAIDRGGRGRGLTGFVVPGDSPGITGEPIDLIAPHPIGRLHFEDVQVPSEYVLGEPDRGFAVAMRTLDMFRPSVGAFAVGMAQAAIDAAVAYMNERHAFGKPLSGHQAIAHRLADIATRVQAARLLVHAAAEAYDARGVIVRRRRPPPSSFTERVRLSGATHSSASIGRCALLVSLRAPPRSRGRSSRAASFRHHRRRRSEDRDSRGRSRRPLRGHPVQPPRASR